MLGCPAMLRCPAMTERNLIFAVIALGALLGGTLVGQVILHLHDKKAQRCYAGESPA